MISILFLLAEHGDLTFEELADIIGSGADTIELQCLLDKLKEQKKIVSYKNDNDLNVYTLNQK